MAVNEDFMGREFPLLPPVDVTAEWVGEFASSVGATNAMHHDARAARDAGFDDVVAPPTFAVVIAQKADAQLIEDPEAGIDFTRVVHGQQSFTHHTPIVAGMQISAVLHVDAVRPAGGHVMVTTRSELSDADGSPVCTASSTIVIRGEQS